MLTGAYRLGLCQLTTSENREALKRPWVRGTCGVVWHGRGQRNACCALGSSYLTVFGFGVGCRGRPNRQMV